MSGIRFDSESRRSAAELFNRVFQSTIALTIIVILWETAVRLFSINPVFLPSPSRTMVLFVTEFPSLTEHASVTTIEIFAGFWAGVVFGFTTALLIFYIPFFRRGLYPALVGINQVPKISFAPLLLVLFGAGLVTNMIITALIVFFPMLVNTIVGLGEASEELIELSDLYQANEPFILRKIRLPSALPLIMAAMKLSTTLAVVGAIVAEFVSASSGLGFLIIRSSNQLQTTRLYAAIIYVTIIAVILYAIVLLIERKLVFWQDS